MVQANHACFEMGMKVQNKPQIVCHMVLCLTINEEELDKLSTYLKGHGIAHHMFYEPDFETGHTAICTEPIYNEQRKLFKKFKLLKL